VETRYIVRTLVQNLRVNANWRSIIGPLARAVIMHRDGAGAPKASLDAAAAAALDAFHTCPSLDLLVPALVEGGIEEMRRRCSLTPGAALPQRCKRSGRRNACMLASSGTQRGTDSQACRARCLPAWEPPARPGQYSDACRNPTFDSIRRYSRRSVLSARSLIRRLGMPACDVLS